MLRCYWDDGVVIECVVSGVWLWLGGDCDCDWD